MNLLYVSVLALACARWLNYRNKDPIEEVTNGFFLENVLLEQLPGGILGKNHTRRMYFL